MTGSLRILAALAVLILAGGGIYFLWTGTIPQDVLKMIGTLGIVAVLTIAVTLITRPAGEKH